MKVDCQFKNLDYSESLVEYANERAEKIQKFMLHKVKVHFVISKQRHQHKVDVAVLGSENSYKAQASSNDFYVSIDLALSKLKRQMIKKKSKVQHYKDYDQSHEGRLENLAEDLSEKVS